MNQLQKEMANKIYKELILFFENKEVWDKEEIVNIFMDDVLKTFRPNFMAYDDIILKFYDDEFASLKEFSMLFFDRIMEGVRNSIKAAQNFDEES